MDRITVWVDSETAPLTHVVIGLPDNFHLTTPETINEAQRRSYFTEIHPDRAKLKREFSAFRKVLEENGVTVFQPDAVDGVPDQLTPRDIGFVIGDTLVRSNMAKRSRTAEWRGLKGILQQLDTPVTHLPEQLIIEGGDIVIHNEVVYVGISERTSYKAAHHLAQKFPNYEILPLPLRPPQSGQEILHLDCAFLPVGQQQALIYPDGFMGLPTAITDQYELIEVTSQEQKELAVNVLSLSPGTVVSRSQAKRVNALLRQTGIKVIELDFDEAPKTGGSFRCCSLPFRRRSG